MRTAGADLPAYALARIPNRAELFPTAETVIPCRSCGRAITRTMDYTVCNGARGPRVWCHRPACIEAAS